jgi:hypothetical protein
MAQKETRMEQKEKNVKFGPNYEFGTKPNIGYFFAPFELLSAWKRA